MARERQWQCLAAGAICLLATTSVLWYSTAICIIATGCYMHPWHHTYHVICLLAGALLYCMLLKHICAATQLYLPCYVRISYNFILLLAMPIYAKTYTLWYVFPVVLFATVCPATCLITGAILLYMPCYISVPCNVPCRATCLLATACPATYLHLVICRSPEAATACAGLPPPCHSPKAGSRPRKSLTLGNLWIKAELVISENMDRTYKYEANTNA